MEIEFCVDESKNKFRLLKEIARGGQGAVYQSQFPNLVVKLELKDNKPLPTNDAARKKFLAVRTLPKVRDLNVTLPLNVLEKVSGYTMKMMDDMTSFQDAFAGEVDEQPLESPWLESFAESNPELATFFFELIKRGGLRRFFRAYLYAAQILSEIHGAGLVYCDFSWNNVFISKDVNFCNVWLIDADNLDFQKNTRQKIFFTPDVGAPELQDGSGGCTFYSDAFAFASTMFQQLTHHHPFEGALFDEKLDEMEREGAEAYRNVGGFPWVFDSDDEENFWDGGEIFLELIPPAIMELFNRTFDKETGLFKIGKRPALSEWSFELAKTADQIVRCPNCKMDYHSATACPWCDNEHPVLMMNATFANGAELWNFSREISTGEVVDVPLRIVHGYKSAELDEVAFKFVRKEKSFELVRVSEKFSAEFEDDTTARMTAAGFETSQEKFFVYCTDAEHFASRIEVEIIHAT